MKYGYAPISSIDQNPDMQLKALQRAGCKKIFTDRRTGASTKRPALTRCLNALKDGDRLTRLETRPPCATSSTWLRTLSSGAIHFRSTEEINTATPGGKLTFHIFGALADLNVASSSSAPAKA